MIKGEPLALSTIIMGLLWFPIVQLFGVFYSGIFDLPVQNVAQLHYLTVFLGWIGFTILGSELQFFRAFAGHRRYSPEVLRWVFLLSLPIGLVTALYGTWKAEQSLVNTGLIIYGIGVLVHSYWLQKLRGSKLFKFPLDYQYVAQFFFLTGYVTLVLDSFSSVSGIILNLENVSHIWTIGWITIVLQGSLVRILPMFVGKVIDREMRPQIPYHLLFTTFASMFLTAGLIIYSTYFTKTWVLYVGVLLYSISWVWVFTVIYRSLTFAKRKTINKVSLFYFIPGMMWFVVGLTFGALTPYTIADLPWGRRLHIHFTLLLGLSFIMLGAIHRITAFQIYSIIFTGKRDSAPGLIIFHKDRTFIILATAFYLVQVVIAYGLIAKDFLVFGYAGLAHLIVSMVFVLIILSNYLFYHRHKADAIPFDKTVSEA